MSMTREEAIKHLLLDFYVDRGCEFKIRPGRLDDFLAAIDLALSAIRPVSREQVEKVWRGEWEHPGYYDDGGSFVHDCSKCNTPSTDEY